jgi:hypothetical protein
VFASRGWMRFALICNLLGTVLLFLSFQATSSNITIVRDKTGSTYLCIGQVALFATEPMGGFVVGTGCPQSGTGRPISVVNVELPFLVTLGFIFASLGFLLQLLSLPNPKTISQMRADIKAAKMEQRLKDEQNKLTRIR